MGEAIYACQHYEYQRVATLYTGVITSKLETTCPADVGMVFLV